MSRVFASELDTEYSSVSYDHELLNVLRGRNLKLEIETLYTVGTINHGTDDSSYLLAVVSHLQAPFDEVDVVNADRKETLVCGCPGFFHHCYDGEVGAKIDDCKHTERVKQLRRTELAENQATLTGS